MVPFLKQTAQFLCTEFQNKFENLCIVLPNRRAGLFLRKYLAETAGITTWAPEIMSIEDFIVSISGMQEIDQVNLVFELYEVHQEINGEKSQSFEEFYQWAPQLLSDFNEIDKYLADPADLFSTLTEARAISLWNPDGRPLTDFEMEYLRFYRSLKVYYEKFKERLTEKNQSYQGAIFRSVAEKINQVIVRMTWGHVVFAGFNAITKAEEEIIHALKVAGKATLLFDADKYYVNNEKQEAGEFLRRWLLKWPEKEVLWLHDGFANGKKEITIIGSPDPVGQIKYCGSLLSNMAASGRANETTAVVLLDTGLLIPLLHSIPDEVKELNITAGMPLNQTPLASLFDTIFEMHARSERLTETSSGMYERFYYTDVLKLLQHPYLQLITISGDGDSSNVFSDISEKIRNGVQAFISYKDLAADQGDLFRVNLDFLEPAFRHWESPADAMYCFTRLIERIKTSIEEGQRNVRQKRSAVSNNFDMVVVLEFLYAFSKISHQLSNLLKRFPNKIKLLPFRDIFKQVTASTTLPFYGEPLKGIQLMGMLETRTLDFENLIILSCNDDLLPAGKINNSYIPFDIKWNFGLPTYRQKDAVYAYHFYRLIQRASNITIMYNTEPDQLGGGDQSRFIRQIIHELPRINKDITINEKILTTPILKNETFRKLEIRKEGTIIQLLKKKAEKGLSASSLNLYRNCQLKFYYAEIAGIREPEEITDVIDPAMMGSAVHEALHELYKPLLNNILTSELLQTLLPGSSRATTQALNKKLKGQNVSTGKNLLMLNVAKLLVDKLIKFDIEDIREQNYTGSSHYLAFLESYLESSVTINFQSEEIEVKLKGFIDRVDKVDGFWRIIDYKTGLADPRNIKITDWEDLADKPELNIGFQLLMYGLLLQSKLPREFRSDAGIISLRKIGSGFMAVSVPSDIPGQQNYSLDEQVIGNFKQVLTRIIADIYDIRVPFVQTQNIKVCGQGIHQGSNRTQWQPVVKMFPNYILFLYRCRAFQG